jgi:DNA-binding phage protein
MKFFWNEEWKEIEMADDTIAHRKKYAVSNYGRVVSYVDTIETGKLLKLGFIGGYPVLSLSQKVKHSRCVHKLVACYFLPTPEAEQKYVVHLDFDKHNNIAKNLKWATKEEMLSHQDANPQVLFARQHHPDHTKGAKLTSQQVKRLKKAINAPDRKRTLKQIAKRYGISEMQLYRIKSGENWSHIES